MIGTQMTYKSGLKRKIFVADGITDTFNCSDTMALSNDYLVFIGGVEQTDITTRSGNSVVTNTILDDGTRIMVIN